MKKLGLGLAAILVLLLVLRGGAYVVAKHKWDPYDVAWTADVAAERARCAAVRRLALHGAPLDENVVPRYAGLIASLPKDDPARGRAFAKDLGNWDQPLGTEFVALAVDHRELIAKLREAVRCTRVDWQIPYETALTAPTPDLIGSRLVTSFLAIEARACADRGDFAGACDRSVEGLRVGLDFESGSPLIATMIGVAIARQALDGLGNAVVHAAPGAVPLDALAADLEKLEEGFPEPTVAFRGERLALHSFVTTYNAKVQAIPTWEFYAYQIPDIDALYHELDKAQAITDRAERKKATLDVTARAQASNEPLLALAWPNVSRVPELLDDSVARYRLVRAAIAVERMRGADGSYPKDASGLSLPLDPFATGPIHYQVSASGKGYKVWSVWHDGKDDGGTPPAPGATGEAAEKGDLVLERKG